MAKDSYWFKHDSTAGRGTRMRKMAFIYGHWGKGIYWDVIEILRDQSGYKFELDNESLRLLADLIGCKDEGKFINWFNDCVRLDLLQTDENHFFSQVLLENMGVWETKKLNGSKTKSKRNESEIEAKQKHKIIEDNIRIDIKPKKIFFKDSLIFDINKFKEQFENWNIEKIKYYHDALNTWSNEGNKKIDWVATARTWASRDEKAGKIKFDVKKPTISINNQFSLMR
jgi:hypothetical protein